MKIKLLGLLLMFFAVTAFVACNGSGDVVVVEEDDCDINPLDPGCQVPVEEAVEPETDYYE